MFYGPFSRDLPDPPPLPPRRRRAGSVWNYLPGAYRGIKLAFKFLCLFPLFLIAFFVLYAFLMIVAAIV